MQFVDEVEGTLGVGGAFHIDAHEISGRHVGGFGDQAAHDFVGQLLVDVEAHVGELEADVGVELVGGDFVEQVVIEVGAGASLVGVGDVLSEVVDGDAGSELIHRGGGANGVGDLRAGDEAGAGALAKAGALGDGAQ